MKGVIFALFLPFVVVVVGSFTVHSNICSINFFDPRSTTNETKKTPLHSSSVCEQNGPEHLTSQQIAENVHAYDDEHVNCQNFAIDIQSDTFIFDRFDDHRD